MTPSTWDAGSGGPEDATGIRWARLGGLIGGVGACTIMLLLPAPEGLSTGAWYTAAVGALMAIWWITEAIPIAATALVPLVLFPALGVAEIGAAAEPFANPLIFLFLGGFIIAQAMQKWGLHKRIALSIIRVIGTRPRSIVGGFMISSALLSMWVSNTATALMMLPIALSVVHLARPDPGALSSTDSRNFTTALLLTIAYGCSIGGTATLIGTPTNALLAAFMDETFGLRISFVQWMLIGVPFMSAGLGLTYVVLTRLLFPIRAHTLPGGRAVIDRAHAQLGQISRPERLVAIVFGLVAVLWVCRPLLADVIPGITDTGIAIFGALLLFIIPVNVRNGRFLLDWNAARQLPWGVLLLFGGGLSLASSIQDTGLAAWIGSWMTGLSGWPILLLLLAVVAIIILLTELTSNTATAAAFLPIVAAAALGIGQNPLLFAIPTALAASCAFMLPVATPPNAIVYGSGQLTIPQMARAGIWINLIFIGLISALMYTVVFSVFDLQIDQIPPWVDASRLQVIE